MLGVPEIGLPQGICWESHDEPGREPRPQGTIALSTQGAQPGSPEDKRWPLSLAVTMDVQTPTPQQPKVSPGGDFSPYHMGRGHAAMGCPSANPSRVGTAGPKGLSLCWRSRVIYHVLAHVAHPTGLKVFLGSPPMTFFRCTRCPIHSQFTGATAWATSTTHPPQPPRVIPGPQVLDSPRGVR